MARTKLTLGHRGLEVHYDITETFTHRVDAPGGRILRGDPENRFWMEENARGSGSWYGVPPAEWNPAAAKPEPHTRRYDDWWDVS